MGLVSSEVALASESKPENGVVTEAVERLGRELGQDPYALMQLLLSLAKKTTLNRIIRPAEYPIPAQTPDLDHRLRLFEQCISSNAFEAPRIFSELYKKCIREEYRKKRGQYFTPKVMAKAIPARLRLTFGDCVLEPGIGTGIITAILLRSLGKDSERIDYVGVEIDSLLALSAAVSLDLMEAPRSWRILYANYLGLDQLFLRRIGVQKVTAIVSNPPFVRFHGIHGKKRMINRISQRAGLRLSGLSGLHSFFLAQSASLLESGGRMAFIFPYGMEYANHGAELLKQLESRFECTKTAYEDLALFTFVERQVRGSAVPISDAGNRLMLSAIASVHRGISTGANDFFVINDEDVKMWQIPRDYLLKVVPSRMPLHGNAFGLEEWNRARQLGKPCWLLHIPKGLHEERIASGVKQYLDEGMQRKINLISTCAIRDKWYSVKLMKPPDLIFTYMYRKSRRNKTGKPCFIYNGANAYILTNLLGVYLKSRTSLDQMPKIAAKLTKSVSDWIDFEDVGRRYEGGFRKLEPGDLGQLPISSNLLRTLAIPSMDTYLPKPQRR